MHVGQPCRLFIGNWDIVLVPLLLHGTIVGGFGETEVVVGDSGGDSWKLLLLLSGGSCCLPGLPTGRGGLLLLLATLPDDIAVEFAAGAVGSVQVGVD